MKAKTKNIHPTLRFNGSVTKAMTKQNNETPIEPKNVR